MVKQAETPRRDCAAVRHTGGRVLFHGARRSSASGVVEIAGQLGCERRGTDELNITVLTTIHNLFRSDPNWAPNDIVVAVNGGGFALINVWVNKQITLPQELPAIDNTVIGDHLWL